MATTRNIKEIREDMRTISQLLNKYQAADKAQLKTFNSTQYDACVNEMQDAYNAIVNKMQEMLIKVGSMGILCNALDILSYLKIEEKSFRA